MSRTTDENKEAIIALCKVFGVEPDALKSFTFRMANDEIMMAHFEIYVSAASLKETVNVLQYYDLVPLGAGLHNEEDEED